MGFLLVEYPMVRKVFIDGMPCGATKTPFQVSNGYHQVDLGPDLDYSPYTQRVRVQGEPYQAPITASFQPR